VIEVRDLSYKYKSAKTPVFSGLMETFERGEMVAICGESGRGKSTLMYLLGLMLRPATGEILLQGQPTSHLKDSSRAGLRASLLGFVFQDAVLDPARSVIDNVLEGSIYRGRPRRSDRVDAFELLERFEVAIRGEAKPSQISGGQAQRIALCRALMCAPPIVIADEPTGNLDWNTASLVVNALDEHSRAGNTVIIATHDPRVMAACTRVVTL
jgi:ABC-type lipoprotein export system ATPase subunit